MVIGRMLKDSLVVSRNFGRRRGDIFDDPPRTVEPADDSTRIAPAVVPPQAFVEPP